MGFQSLVFLLLLALTASLCPAVKSRGAGIALLTLVSVVFYLWGLGEHALNGLAVRGAGGCVTFAAAR